MSWDSYSDSDPADIQREIEKRRQRGEPFEQITCTVPRGIPASTFWGIAWGQNLERYSDYESRIPRGRLYLRKGNVYDLTITTGEIFAYVTGSEIYEVLIKIDQLSAKRWAGVKKETAGQIGNLVDLLGGTLGPGAIACITDQKMGLFPEPSEIHLSCTCPDWADMCKHVAATLYAVGVKLDQDPGLFFTLRDVSQEELIFAAAESASKATDLLSFDPSAGILHASELSELFGIEITEPEAAFL
jgi:uncharacterized Zn finger protein